jgi:hypothetical protein
MRNFLSGTLPSLLFLASLGGSSSPVKAEEYDQQYSNKYGADIQPYARDYSDRKVINPEDTYRAPENVNPLEEQATGDADSYQQPPRGSHRFGSEKSYGLFRFPYRR